MLDDYKFNFSQVNNIINKLPDSSKEKIPDSFRNFVEKNSDFNSNLLDNADTFINKAYSEETLKLLKIVDYYINNDNYRM